MLTDVLFDMIFPVIVQSVFVVNQGVKIYDMSQETTMHLDTLRSLSSLLGDSFREFWEAVLGGVRGYSGGIWRSFWRCFRAVWKEKRTITYNKNYLVAST